MAKKIGHGPFRFGLCSENMDFPAIETQIVNYSLSGYAPPPLHPFNYFREPTFTFVINNLQISHQKMSLLLYKPNI